MKRILTLLLCLCVSLCISGCGSTPDKDKASSKNGATNNRVVLYCSVDDVYAKPIVAELEKKTGLQIDVLYDVEAAKTAGLANRIRAEKNRPRGDVFWSSALLQTLLLKREGLLQEYSSPSAKEIPAAFKDAKGIWTGMGVRARVFMFHSIPPENKLIPLTGRGLPNVYFKNKIGISNPQFGTASDWVSALTVRWGKKKTLDYFRALKKNGVRVLPGNGVVAEKIAVGELMAGITDSDDYNTFAKKHPGIWANTFDSDVGVLVPGSVAILKDAPHSENAKILVDALVSGEGENLLVSQMPGVLPTRHFPLDEKEKEKQINSFFTSPIFNDTDKWADAWLSIRDPLFEILLTP